MHTAARTIDLQALRGVKEIKTWSFWSADLRKERSWHEMTIFWWWTPVLERFFLIQKKDWRTEPGSLSHTQIAKRSYPVAILRPAAAVSAVRVPNCRSYKDTGSYLLQGLQSKELQFFSRIVSLCTEKKGSQLTLHKHFVPFREQFVTSAASGTRGVIMFVPRLQQITR